MFALIESCPARRAGGDWAPRAASFAAHSALIAAAVLATQRVVTTTPPPIVDVTMVWTPAPRPDLPEAPAPQTAAPPVSSWTAMPAPPLTIAPDLPPPGPGPVVPGTSGDPIPEPVVGGLPGGLPVASAEPVDQRYVEEQPVMLAHPALDYPELLRRAGIEGRVLVEAVLDTLGRAEPASVRVTSSPHPLFDREALAVVLGSRYRPGRVGGHAVRVRIQVPVSFAIRR